MNFADRLTDTIKRNNSILCAGIDPVIERLPAFITESVKKEKTDSESIKKALLDFYLPALEALSASIACIKPNIAFFEQYGISGLLALKEIMGRARALELPVILDAKRGDIGHTAGAYARAYLDPENFSADFSADALTVNPFLGFDTLKPFIEACSKSGRGIFILVKTSNPGSGDIQDVQEGEKSLSEKIAGWIGEHAGRLAGSSGLSGLGAVVGATYPEEAKRLRELMPQSYFLIPGLGAQGGSGKDALAGLTTDGRGAVVNASRGLFAGFSDGISSRETLIEEILKRAKKFNNALSV
ncbi:MAG: orotidine-5'-phosphate decarboxylase [Candidatus Dadabacteria bacterium]|nr:MAG: orotidine-5'-phosphate decarboxylase [Candidatus Dadabacteria bacterium]